MPVDVFRYIEDWELFVKHGEKPLSLRAALVYLD